MWAEAIYAGHTWVAATKSLSSNLTSRSLDSSKIGWNLRPIVVAQPESALQGENTMTHQTWVIEPARVLMLPILSRSRVASTTLPPLWHRLPLHDHHVSRLLIGSSEPRSSASHGVAVAIVLS